VAALVTCEFCLDIGSEIARDLGVREEQLRELPQYRTSDAFDDDERLVMELAEALTYVPAMVDDDLRARIETRFTPAQRTELAAVIAWENQRARFNQALGVRPSGFSDGQFCALPEPRPASA
jgi:AhpD family alkylhydroperoxidase